MKRNFILVCMLVASVSAFTQISNLKIGYQEFPTIVRGQASDDKGNLYYSGTFTGQLKVNNQTLDNGKGVEDIFLVKTDANGKVLFSRTFGSKYTDGSTRDGLCYFNNNLYVTAYIGDNTDFQSYQVVPYTSGPDITSTSCIVKLDTAGNVVWVNKTSLNLVKIIAVKNVIHVFGNTTPSKGAVRYNNRVLFDSSGYTYQVHLMLDSAGNLLNYKSVTPRIAGQNILTVLYLSAFSDGKICMLLSVYGDQSIQFGQKTITLPAGASNYYVLIKTDTSYSDVSTKVLNTSSLIFPTRGGATGIPISLSAKDSLYMILNTDNPATLSYDGLNVPLYRRNTLVVLDSSLRARRVRDISSSYLGTGNPPASSRGLYFRSISTLANELVFTGVYAGVNESASPAVTRKDTSFPVFPNLFVTADLNGGSKSFVGKTALDFSSCSFSWLGDHLPYETQNLYPTFIHTIHDSLIAFSIDQDNTWNPWIINESLHVLSGSMVPNADGVETVRFVEYLPDGSRIIAGYAKGRTALDPPQASNFTSNHTRNDAFIARITTSGEVKWYKRLNASFSLANWKRLMIRDNRAYFLLNYAMATNTDNYIQTGNKWYGVGTAASILASVDTSGNFTVLNLENSSYKSFQLVDFDFFQNGDIALLTATGSGTTYASFPLSTGAFIFRINRTTNAVVTARKLIGDGSFYPSYIEIDNTDILYLSATLNTTASAQYQFSTVMMYDGTSFTDRIEVENNVTGQNLGGLGIMKLNWNKFIWYKRTSGLNGFGITNGLRPTFVMNNKLYFMGACLNFTGVNPSNGIYWDKQSVVPTFELHGTYIFRLDTSGKVEKQKFVSSFLLGSAKKKGSSTFLIGYTQAATSVDTLSLGYDGAVDAVSIVLDSALAARRAFRIASPYTETMQDMDILNDSLVSFAYSAQTEAAVKDNKAARTAGIAGNNEDVIGSDYAADAFLAYQVLKTFVVLPLKLFSFDAQRHENIVSVSWKIQTGDIGQFIIQRSDNGSAFRNIEERTAASGYTAITYDARDELKNYGQYYYRLQMNSADGKTTYSNIVSILYAAKMSVVYYAPGGQQLQVLRSTTRPYQFTLLDAGGRTVISGQKKSGNMTISLSNQPSGLYIARIWGEDNVTLLYEFVK